MTTAIILAGGTGTRLGADIPKQYIEVNSKPIISYCLDTFVNHGSIDNIQIVADRSWHKYISQFIPSNKFKGFSAPGASRQLSIYNGICDIRKFAPDTDIVIIHDAARPNVSAEMISECISAAQIHDGAIPVLAMKDTVYLSENGNTISSLIPREKLFAGQAPEAFKLGKYIEANERLLPDDIKKINGSTEPAIMYNMDIAMIKGDESNFKITTPADLERFKEMVIK
ncbi:MAG: IspD/TarI family cytidylyltransferase [Oscillospiraceae bacterium]